MIRLMVLSFLVAFVLMAMPMGFEWRWYRPEFVVLLVIYWSMYTPQYFGLTAAWLMGLGLDLITFSPLGLHGLCTLLVAYIAHLTHQRMRNYVLWHQGVWMFILVGVYHLLSHWLTNFLGYAQATPAFLISALLSGFIWPLVVVLLARLQIVWRLQS